ncbi:MAG: nucleotidyltransferase domain-containing protein [candidate division Zixibacteria bacterium]|nr:nucleotidyltransferase domain-containing protein [candidate division Zixibacteria bacterium]
MNQPGKERNRLISSLQERAKELKCLYAVEELLNHPDVALDDVLGGVVQVIPPAMQYPQHCAVKIVFEDSTYQSPNYVDTSWVINANVIVQDKVVGKLSVAYIEKLPDSDCGPFLREEATLINAVADRLGHFIMYYRMRNIFQSGRGEAPGAGYDHKEEWRVALDLLRQTDRNLFLSISHKMLNYLCWTGIDEAKKLLLYYSPDQRNEEDELMGDTNRPYQKKTLAHSSDFLSDETFKIAADHLSNDEILSVIQKWIQENQVSFLVRTVNRNSPLSEVSDAIRRYYRMPSGEVDTASASHKGVRVSLIRRFFSDQLDFINIAKNYIDVADFNELIQTIIFTTESQGKLGGKTAGLFLASQILKKLGKNSEFLANLKTPRTWYITSDVLLYFVQYNNLEEVVEQKYKEINQVRLEYPHIMQTFKNAHFPPDIIKGLSVALDDFKDKPLIVRSSSLLEDRMGSAFSGKYKSLFLANQGSKQKRLEALMDAIAEVYASVFGPDPIEYRAERGLLDFNEEMGIMIQEVVGTRIGRYYMPVFGGVAFSKNEFRWSARIKREDGLIRFVPGLGTRAVDRLSDDYPLLVAPGQPGLRVNVTADEITRYSPKKIDVINLETNTFETIQIADLMLEYGDQIPNIKQIVSICDDDHFHQPVGTNIDFSDKNLVVTFEGMISRTPFIVQVHNILKILEEKLKTPVDIEFASDGKDFYLLQCRPQSYSDAGGPAPIPKEIPEERILFSANRYVSNGRVPDITHVVYVDPQQYGELGERSDLLAVGRCVSRLNEILPKRQFILMGPGRWGSRGDIKMGVSVTYSDINNTAVLIEIARKKGNYLPDLSFGTHFFQDLVEASIRYLPLYPDDPGIVFNERFLRESPNILAEVLPEFAYLGEAIRLIDIPRSTNGQILRVLMNADLDEAVGILTQPSSQVESAKGKTDYGELPAGESWRWRLQAAGHMASQLNPEHFGVKGFYIFGSTKNGTAGPGSDIDILIHFDGTPQQRALLNAWLEGWSLCLDEINYLRTGYRVGGLLDIQIVTDDDIAAKNSYAAKIGAVTDAARPLPMGKAKA